MIHSRQVWNNNKDALFWSLVGADMSYDEKDFSLLDEGWGGKLGLSGAENAVM